MRPEAVQVARFLIENENFSEVILDYDLKADLNDICIKFKALLQNYSLWDQTDELKYMEVIKAELMEKSARIKKTLIER